MSCAVNDCPDDAGPVQLRINTYTDHTHVTRDRRTLTVELCERHRFVHGYVWTPKNLDNTGMFPIDYELYNGKRVGPKALGGED